MKERNLTKYIPLITGLISILTATGVLFLEKTNIITQTKRLIFKENITIGDTTAINDTTRLIIPDTTTHKLNVLTSFFPGGYMADASLGEKYVKISDSFHNYYSPPSCSKIDYNPGPMGWAGIFWQNKPDNWGNFPGDNLEKFGYTKIVFMAKGEKGNERVEFRAGGIQNTNTKYQDSFDARLVVSLSKEWKQFAIDLRNKNLSSVIGGFCWVANVSSNPNGLVFYLDDIYYR